MIRRCLVCGRRIEGPALTCSDRCEEVRRKILEAGARVEGAKETTETPTTIREDEADATA